MTTTGKVITTIVALLVILGVKEAGDLVGSQGKDRVLVNNYYNQTINVVAHDAKRGWSIVIPDVSPRRFRVRLDPTVDPGELAKAERVRATVEVRMILDDDYNEIPADGTIISVHMDDDSRESR